MDQSLREEAKIHFQVGGTSEDPDGAYILGVDALQVLRDLKKWLRFYDEKTNRMDVARCLADCNIVCNDLLPIISLWTASDESAKSKFRSKCSLACYELLVPLTWPLERDEETMTQNHHRHLPVLELAQLGYKRDIINFDGACILNSAVRSALPSVAIPIGGRSARDSGIIKLVLYLLRNIAMIDVPSQVTYTDSESLIARSVTIDSFHYQDIFLFLLTLASNMGDDFRTEDLIIIETLFHLVKRIDPNKLFMSSSQAQKAESNELKALIHKEKTMVQGTSVKQQTRHSRFGTMVWVKRADGKVSTVTGQDALWDSGARKRKMDSSKIFKPMRKAKKENMEPKDLGRPVSLTSNAATQLRQFVDDFLDSGFNPLFQHARKSLEREAPYVLKHHKRQFFYLVAWFLQAERARKNAKKKDQKQDSDDVGSFNLVAGVLNQEMFIFVQRNLSYAFNEKEWVELGACMKCFSQILLTVQDMTQTGVEEDEEIADNILSRIFYEEDTHDLVARIASSFKDQGFEYLDASTELVHIYLRILEAYSKQNVDLMVRSKRRTRKRKNAVTRTAASGEQTDENAIPDVPGEDEGSGNDEAAAQRETKERKFDFARFASRFIAQGVVDTFVAFARFYEDLDESQLKRAHRYFYRVAFKQEMSVMLFRVDILQLLFNMMKGPHPLDKSNAAVFKEWEELVRQIIKKCFRKIEERPVLLIEMLFSKISASAFYLEYGYEKQTMTKPRPGAELEVKSSVEGQRRRVAIAVSVLLDRGMQEHVWWVKEQLAKAEDERRSWENAHSAMVNNGIRDPTFDKAGEKPIEPWKADKINVRPDNEERKMAMFKNSHLRLLMKLVGFERAAPDSEETPDSTWIIPASRDADSLKESHDFVKDAEFAPPTFDAGETAEDYLRRSSTGSGAAKKRQARKAEYDEDDDDDIDEFLDDDLESMFPPGGPTARKADEHTKTKRSRLRRKKGGDGDEKENLDEKATKAAERRRKRKERELEKMRKIKSRVYVHDSDTETDEEADKEFFRREEELRVKMDRIVRAAIAREEERERREEMGIEMSESDDASRSGSSGDEAFGRNIEGSDEENWRRRKRKSSERDDEPAHESGRDENGDEDREDDVSTQPVVKKRKVLRYPEAVEDIAEKGNGAMDIDEDEDDDAPLARLPARKQAVRSGFIMESSDEDE